MAMTETPARPDAQRGLEANGKTTAASQVYRRLRADILQGALEPSSKLRIDFLCARYRAGGSPVREALNRLSSEGFVDREDQRGFFVAPVSLKGLRELVKTRRWLEARALQEAIANRSNAWEEAIVLALHRLTRTVRFVDPETGEAPEAGRPAGTLAQNPAWESHHHAFHHALIASCGSSILLRYCEELRDRSDRYRLIAAASVYPRRNDRDEHRAIAEAALEGRSDEAVALLMAHYERTLGIIEGHFSAGG
ncbi:GntR family transcriptional regulator [Marinivivus vitaminiproducens]|uniref:GntR family transcriptional regulator n=1 Tax=Marinivivus vitaminiproducens TaxID=3035935 RepID=UPI00279DA7CE|nr:GntR family transcriptional regulator [Geminicoccaceae bacterium SCSIO 64248]